MDLHQKEIQGFFNFPIDNLRASPFLIQYIQEEVYHAVGTDIKLCIFLWEPQFYIKGILHYIVWVFHFFISWNTIIVSVSLS